MRKCQKLAQKNPAMIHKNKTKTTENILAFLQPLTVLSIHLITLSLQKQNKTIFFFFLHFSEKNKQTKNGFFAQTWCSMIP